MRVLCVCACAREMVLHDPSDLLILEANEGRKAFFVCCARCLIYCCLRAVESDSSSDDDDGDLHPSPPNPKRAKAARSGAARYNCRYNEDWKKDFPFIERGKTDRQHSFYCKMCKKDVSCSHQGKADVKRHEKSSCHAKNVSVIEQNALLVTMGFVPRQSMLEKKVVLSNNKESNTSFSR